MPGARTSINALAVGFGQHAIVEKETLQIVNYNYIFASILFTLMGSAKFSKKRCKKSDAVSGTLRPLKLTDHKPTLRIRTKRGEKKAFVIECLAGKINAQRTVSADLESHSTLTVIFVWNGKTSVTITQRFSVGAGARLHLVNITRGSCVHETLSEVTGRNGESCIDWIIHGQGTMQCCLSARNVFLGRNGKGDLQIRGVVEGKARVSCNGAVEVGPKASGTQARLTEKILLLDPTARADVIPSLDVKTHDVQAGHSASISRIHPEDLFYFASRGISQKKARKLFIDGFLGQLFDSSMDAGVRALAQNLKL